MPSVIDLWLRASALACLIAAVVTITLWIIGPRGPSDRARMYRAIWALAALASIPASAIAVFAPSTVSATIAAALASSATGFYVALTLATAAQSAHPRHSYVAAGVLLVFVLVVTGVLS